MERKNVLKEKSFEFAIKIVEMYKFLCESKREFVLSKQVLRSGTSIGANVREANHAQSGKDFIHKLSIAQKECDETLYWLELLYTTKYITEDQFNSLSNEAIELIKIITKSILTKKTKSIKRLTINH